MSEQSKAGDLDSLRTERDNALEREAATREILQVINQSRDDEAPVFDVIVENALRLCDAGSAGIMRLPVGGTHLQLIAERGLNDAMIEMYREHPPPLDPDQSLHARTMIEKQVLNLPDLAAYADHLQQSYWGRSASDAGETHSLLIVPMVVGEGCVGTIAVYRGEVRPFDTRHVELLKTFADQAAIAIENVRQFKALETLNAELGYMVEEQVGEIERMGRLKRFLSPAVADAVVTSGDEKMLSSHRALIATLFCDIRGFTAFCETAEPEETIEVLQTYHEEMGRLIRDHGAGVDTRSGDGIMVIFNDPLPCDDPAGEAVKLGVAMRARMGELCAEWRKLGHRLGFGVGISLGYATVGMVGSEGRYDYTASGTAVNLAARLCDHADDGEILISPRAFRAVEEAVEADAGGELLLKGIQTPVDVMRVTRLKDTSSPGRDL